MLTTLVTSLSRLSTRLKRGDLHRTLGRFKLARQTYSFCQNKYQWFNADFHKQRLHLRETSFLVNVSPERCVQDLRQQAVAFGLYLPPTDVSAVLQFAETSPCREPGFAGDWYAHEVKNGLLKEKRPVFRGLVQ
jgi:hypothetical protein